MCAPFGVPITVSGHVVAASYPRPHTGTDGTAQLCAHVSDLNTGTEDTIKSNAFWALQPAPPGRLGVGAEAIAGSINGGGYIHPGQMASGYVCFEDPQTAGPLWLLWSPPEARAVWGGNPPCRPEDPPRVVVVMLMGINSELHTPSTDPYNPLLQDQCKFVGNSNAALNDLGQTFDTLGTGSDGYSTLLSSLASTRALILPFSYNGAYFVGGLKEPAFLVRAYDKIVPNSADIFMEARVLDAELESIRGTWSNAKIVIIGHSNGGLVAKQWWRDWDGRYSNQAAHARAGWNVAGVYSLNSPDNGGSNPIEALQLLFDPGTCGLGPFAQAPCITLAQEYSVLWYQFALDQRDDTSMAQTDTGDRGIFTPVGTRGDIIMELLSWSSKLFFVEGEESGPQLLADFSSDGQINTLLEPGRITPTVGSSFELTDSHGIVYRDPDNIAFLTAAVAVAGSGSARAARATALAPNVLVDSGRIPFVTGPSAHLTMPVSPSLGTITIDGTDLGVSPGTIAVVRNAASKPVLAQILTWTNTVVTAKLPDGTPDGLVIGLTAAGQSFVAGPLTILGLAGPVSSLDARTEPGPAPAATNAPLLVTAKDGTGHPAAGVTVTLSDGLEQTSRTTDLGGQITFQVAGVGKWDLVVTSGATWTPVTLSWSPPASTHVSLTSDDVHPRVGSSVAVVAKVLDASGKPMAGAPVAFRVVGPKGATVAAPQVAADANGVARTRVTSPSPGKVIVGAASVGGLGEDTLVLDWELIAPTSRKSRASFPNMSIIVYGLAALTVGVGFVALVILPRWRRSRRRGRPS